MKNTLFAFILIGCTSAAPLKTVDNIAHEACGVYFAQERDLSLEEAADAFCFTEDQLRPFVQGLRTAGKRADARARMMVR